MAKVKTGIIRVPPGTPPQKVIQVLAENGAKPGEQWTTTDSGLTWRKEKGQGGNAEVHESYSAMRGSPVGGPSRKRGRRKRVER